MIDVDVSRYTDAKLRQEFEHVDYALSVLAGDECSVARDHRAELRRFRQILEGERGRRHMALPLFSQAQPATDGGAA